MEKIIFTGASSFTGYHFIRELNEKNIKVNILFSFKRENIKYFNYNKIIRIKYLMSNNNCFYDCTYGNKKFIKILLGFKNIDYFCHHFAYTKDYNNNKFDFFKSIKINTNNCEEIISILKKKNLKKYIYTGSYFEPKLEKKMDTKIGLYGISKKISGDILKIFSDKINLKFIKFIIPNPFGELEDENRLPTIITNTWKKGDCFEIRFPMYIRDYIPVSILRKLYFNFIFSSKRENTFNPSFAIISNLKFISSLSIQIKKKTGLECKFISKKGLNYSEPLIIKNSNKNHNYYKYRSKIFMEEELDFYKNLIKG